MITEGDARVEDWQTWEDNGPEPKAPDGMVAGGPWFPFAAFVLPAGEDYGARSVVVHRRPLMRAVAADPFEDLAAEFDKLAGVAKGAASAAFQQAASMARAKR
jgi:hypothetical protein